MDTQGLREHLSALSDWWEGAGVDVDRRQIERLIQAASKSRKDAATPAASTQATTAAPVSRKASSALNEARALAAACQTLDNLRDAITRYEGCELKAGATKTVIADGNPDADIVVIGEGPGRDEDNAGLPFVGKTGHLLDKMLASIGLSRNTNTYITNVNFWRPPGNRNPTDEELALCRPFVDKHLALVQPKLIIAAGTVPAKALLGVTDGITRLRGKRYELTVPGLSSTVPVYPIFHPAYLLRRPAEKAKAWADLLTIQKVMEELGIAPKAQP